MKTLKAGILTDTNGVPKHLDKAGDQEPGRDQLLKLREHQEWGTLGVAGSQHRQRGLDMAHTENTPGEPNTSEG